jgi:hypothetical protein
MAAAPVRQHPTRYESLPASIKSRLSLTFYCVTNTRCMFSVTAGLTSVSMLVVFDTTFQVLVNVANGNEAPRPNTIDSVDVLP